MVDLILLRGALTVAAAAATDEVSRRICDACLTAMPVAGVAISVMTDANHRDVVYASDADATELEELQFSLGEGPCVEAFTTGRPVLVVDLDDALDPRWPMFAAAATTRTPVRAAYAFPLRIGAIPVGSLDLYRVEPGPLDPSEHAAALLVADAAVRSLLDRPALTAVDETDRAGSAGPPLVLHCDHSVIHQATGMVIAQARVNVETALALLRAYAFAHDRPLHAVAADVVAVGLRVAEADTS